MNISEEFLHYIWKNRLFKVPVYLSTGEEAEIIDTGQYNPDAGPDFFNAKIRIDGTIWAGNVEIHINASDWYKHGHHHDTNYQNIILHIVYKNDCEVQTQDGPSVAVAEIRFSKEIFNNYAALLRNTDWVACGNAITLMDPVILNLWLDRMMIEKLQTRAEEIRKNYMETKGNWNETIYRSLARNFGFKLNAMPFELLSRSLPFKLLQKHQHNIQQVEALLFGQAGFLEEPDGDDYYRNLRDEYFFLKKKYSITPVGIHLWKFLRLRPANFPTVRIAQFAHLICIKPEFIPTMLDKNPEILKRELLDVTTSSYWTNHYVFNKIAIRKIKNLGIDSAGSLIINTIIPIFFEFGRQTDNKSLIQRAFTFLGQIPPEENKITRGWMKLGLPVPDAFYSQALIHLKNHYCNLKKCLFCEIGNRIIR